MMSIYTDLKKSTIAISKVRDQQISAKFCFSGNLDVFTGHFPENPILPGIVQIEMVKFVVEQTLSRAFSIQSIRKTKFVSLIHPEVPIHISIRITPADDAISIRATIRTDIKVVCKINMLLH